MDLQGVKVSVSRDGKFAETETGKLQIEGSKIILKKLLGKKEQFDLEHVQSLEHKGGKLIVRLPGIFFVIDFLKPAKEALKFKEAFAQLAGVQLPEYEHKVTIHKEHVVSAVVLVVVVLAIVYFCGGDEKESAEQASETRTSTETPKREAKPEYRIGKTFRLGNFAYTVEKIDAMKMIGNNQFTRTKASEGATFLVVEYTIKNLGKETEVVLADDFRIIDGQGRTFRPSSEANTALMMSGKSKDFLLSEIQPGLKREMHTAFEVPMDAAQSGLKLVIPEKGLLGSDKAEIGFSFSYEK